MDTASDMTPSERIAVMLEQAEALAEWDWTGATAQELAVVEDLQLVEAVLGSAKVAITARLPQGKTASELGWASAKDYLTAVTGGHKGAGPGW